MEEEGSREGEVRVKLDKVQTQLQELEQEVARLGEQEVEEQGLGRRKKEADIAGERCMRLLEQLDNISLDQGMEELRKRRKDIAANINKILDINDANIEAIKQALKGEAAKPQKEIKTMQVDYDDDIIIDDNDDIIINDCDDIIINDCDESVEQFRKFLTKLQVHEKVDVSFPALEQLMAMDISSDESILEGARQFCASAVQQL